MRVALRGLRRDGWLLFLARCTRLFAYGSLAVVLVFYLTSLGFSTSQTGLVLTLTLVGDTAVSFYLTPRADRIGRQRMLIIGALLMALAGLTFAWTSTFVVLIIAGTIGVISPSGNEGGPFLPIEQAAPSQVVPPRTPTAVFAWYTLAGSFATATGSLCGGMLSHLLQRTALPPVGSYRVVVLVYAALGVLLAFLFTRLSPAAEVSVPRADSAAAAALPTLLGVGRSRDVVLKLSGLFALDSFAGGFVVQRGCRVGWRRQRSTAAGVPSAALPARSKGHAALAWHRIKRRLDPNDPEAGNEALHETQVRATDERAVVPRYGVKRTVAQADVAVVTTRLEAVLAKHCLDLPQQSRLRRATGDARPCGRAERRTESPRGSAHSR